MTHKNYFKTTALLTTLSFLTCVFEKTYALEEGAQVSRSSHSESQKKEVQLTSYDKQLLDSSYYESLLEAKKALRFLPSEAGERKINLTEKIAGRIKRLQDSGLPITPTNLVASYLIKRDRKDISVASDAYREAVEKISKEINRILEPIRAEDHRTYADLTTAGEIVVTGLKMQEGDKGFFNAVKGVLKETKRKVDLKAISRFADYIRADLNAHQLLALENYLENHKDITGDDFLRIQDLIFDNQSPSDSLSESGSPSSEKSVSTSLTTLEKVSQKEESEEEELEHSHERRPDQEQEGESPLPSHGSSETFYEQEDSSDSSSRLGDLQRIPTDQLLEEGEKLTERYRREGIEQQRILLRQWLTEELQRKEQAPVHREDLERASEVLHQIEKTAETNKRKERSPHLRTQNLREAKAEQDAELKEWGHLFLNRGVHPFFDLSRDDLESLGERAIRRIDEQIQEQEGLRRERLARERSTAEKKQTHRQNVNDYGLQLLVAREHLHRLKGEKERSMLGHREDFLKMMIPHAKYYDSNIRYQNQKLRDIYNVVAFNVYDMHKIDRRYGDKRSRTNNDDIKFEYMRKLWEGPFQGGNKKQKEAAAEKTYGPKSDQRLRDLQEEEHSWHHRAKADQKNDDRLTQEHISAAIESSKWAQRYILEHRGAIPSPSRAPESDSSLPSIAPDPSSQSPLNQQRHFEWEAHRQDIQDLLDHLKMLKEKLKNGELNISDPEDRENIQNEINHQIHTLHRYIKGPQVQRRRLPKREETASPEIVLNRKK